MKNYRFIFLSLIFVLVGYSFAFYPTILFPLGLFCIFAVLILAKYEVVNYFLVAFPFVDYIFRNYITSFSSIWDELLFIGMIIIWLYKYVRYRKEESFKQTPMDLPIIIFIWAMVLIFIFNSPDYKISFDGLRATVQYILWYFVVLQLLKDSASCKKLCIVLIIITGVMGLHGVYQYIIGVEVPSTWTDMAEAGVRTRVFSILTSPNILGSLMTISLPICTSLVFIEKNKKLKIFFSLLLLSMLATLVFTFSRGAWIGFAGAMFIYILLKDKKLLIPFVLIGILVIILVPSVSNRILYMLSSEYIESSLKGGRLVRWLTGLYILKSYPLLGVGLGHFGGAVAMNYGLSFLIDTELVDTFYMDNYYLKIAVETGILGLIAFIILIYQVIINSIRTIKITRRNEDRFLQIGIFSGLCGIMIHNFVENVFEVPMMTSYFWVLVAVMMRYWYAVYVNER